MSKRNFFAFNRPSAFDPPKIVTGADGDLIITNGQTVYVTPGAVKQYNSVDIQAGGQLIIEGSGLTKTEIGCRNAFTLNGTIICRCTLGAVSSESISGNTTIGNKAYSFTLTQANGGAGGKGGFAGSTAQANGGAQGNGYGGGGGGGASGAGGGTIHGTGGTGGTGSSGGGSAGGGSSAYFPGDKGTGAYTDYGGAGGTGSSGKGTHGSFLFLYLEDVISGTGTVNMQGYNATSNGSNGASGSGPQSLANDYACGGGGGGGSAGGSGGSVLIYKKPASTFTASISVGAGTGSSGGSGATNQSNGLSLEGVYSALAGATGATGVTGSSSINNW